MEFLGDTSEGLAWKLLIQELLKLRDLVPMSNDSVN